MPSSLPPGIYDRVVDQRLQEALARLPPGLREELSDVDPAELPARVAALAAHWIADALAGISGSDRAQQTVRLLEQLGRIITTDQTATPPLSVPAPVRTLKSIAELDPAGNRRQIPRPKSPIGDTFLLTNANANNEPSVIHELKSEIGSADRIDIIMAFIRWSGIRHLIEDLRAHVEAGKPLRIVTTCYTGSTEPRALDELERIGAKVRVSYDTSTTRLHAKAWLFARDSGFSTAYVGSSNLTHSAQITGVEWNVRAAEATTPAIIEKFSLAFETYWADRTYEPYDAENFQRAIERATKKDPGSMTVTDDDEPLRHLVAIHPYPFQASMLEKLELERDRGRHRNLIVAATGTGKTVVAALDYAALRRSLPRARLLFVAHRKEILRQSRDMFRHVLSNGSFGELWVDGYKPGGRADSWQHVFASIQSISAGDIERLPADHFDVVVVDEFHHAAAATYDRLLAYIRPQQLVGLTATPERTDQQDILSHFDNRIAVELRLWDALEQGLLAPFHYFGVHDGTDLSQLPWRRGGAGGSGYAAEDLDNIYTANDLWADKVWRAAEHNVTDIRRMRALGFCASVRHAHFMAKYFERRGLAAVALDAGSSGIERQNALDQLRDGKIQAIFAVDLFNEGLDIPGIDTVLMLRPTDSATIFLQQLGRGLRKTHDKAVLTVLDFVGHQHANFRFEQRFRKLLGRSRTELVIDIEEGFPYLPAGTQIHLDPVARDIVLQNVRQSLPTTWKRRVEELKQLARDQHSDENRLHSHVSLQQYLDHTGLDLTDVYSGGHSWTELRIKAGLIGELDLDAVPTSTDADELSKLLNTACRGIGRLLHVDDLARIQTWSEILTSDKPVIASTLSHHDRRLLDMLALVLFSPKSKDVFASLDEALALLWTPARRSSARNVLHYPIRDELLQVLAILADQRIHREFDSGLSADIPLRVHANYSRDEALAAIGESYVTKPRSHREGVLYNRDYNLDLFFLTLQKTEKEFSPLTRYRDYAISDELFHCESQHTTTVESPTGQRHTNQRSNGSNVMLFVREKRRTPDGRTAPFFCCGLVDYVSHQGSAPIQITWRLRTPLPGDVFATYRAAVA